MPESKANELPSFLEKEDYIEPNCPLCRNPEYRIPVARVMEKLDEYFSRNDTAGAERHLRYWQEDAQRGGDLRGLLSVREEQMGLYRKLGRHSDALEATQEALALIWQLDLSGTVAEGTVLLNAGTVSTAAGDPRKAVSYFQAAEQIFRRLSVPGDNRLSGLYNNMGLAQTATGDCRDARQSFEKALAIAGNAAGQEVEQAITLLNLADLAVSEKGLENSEREVDIYLDRAEALLSATEDNPENIYGISKCAPVFDYYGRFLTAKELSQRAETYYRREK